ncbi:MAG: DUF1559 domain-containing protein [Planctomycetaceae bacterium]|nr:DUF1559 domain-containing protein [Planctomycetaceae bacterium]
MTNLQLERNSEKFRFRSRIGFTLVELLVVMAIISILLALLLPAVQTARSSARATACRNNLKQIGIALQTYHDLHRSFPPGHLETGTNGPAYRHEIGLLTYLLPFVEESNTYELIDFNEIGPSDENPNPNGSASENPAFYEAGGIDVAVFRCPSDPTERVDVTWAPGNYLGNQGPECECRGSDCEGLFGHDTYFNMHDIPDGTTHTIAIGETLIGDLDVDTLEDNYFYRPTGGDASDIDTCQSGVLSRSDRATIWFGGHPQHNMLSTNRPPNDPRFDCIAPNNACSNFAARSAHPGGAFFTYCDGSVHFMGNGVSTEVIQALGSRRGGEIVGE